jgi:hypothetical protein
LCLFSRYTHGTLNHFILSKSIHGASVAEWLRSLTLNNLPLTAVGSNPERDFWFFMWGSYPASVRNVGGSSQVPVRTWNNSRKGTWSFPPNVAKWPILCFCDVKPNKKTKSKYRHNNSHKELSSEPFLLRNTSTLMYKNELHKIRICITFEI